MSTIIICSILIFVMVLTNALYVGAEFATIGARKTRIRQMAGTGNRRAQRLLPILEDTHALDDYIAACQLGITIGSLAVGALGTMIANQVAAFNWLTFPVAITITLVVSTILQVVLGELFPKSVAVQYPEALALFLIYPTVFSQFIFRPLIWFFNGSSRILLRLFGREMAGGHGSVYSPDEIEILVSESHEGGLVADEERQMLRNAFRLDDLIAKQVMVHRTKIITAPINVGADELLKQALDAGYSRIPVYRDSIDEIVGFIHIKDAFRHKVEKKSDLSEIVRDVVYVPDTMPVTDVWEKLNKERQYMAVVFDEHGGTEGIITFEDLIEEIFGELQDEFDDEQDLIRIDREERVHLRADLLVADVNEYLQLSLPEDSAETIGGLVFNALGRRPKIGDVAECGGVPIRVEKTDDTRIDQLSLPKSSQYVIPQIGEWEVQRD